MPRLDMVSRRLGGELQVHYAPPTQLDAAAAIPASSASGESIALKVN